MRASPENMNKSFHRFLIVGAVSTAVNYALFVMLFTTTALSYLVASMIGYISGMLFGYVLNRSWTFGADVPSTLHEIFLYAAVYAFSLALNTVVLAGGVEVVGLSPLIANIVAIGVSTCSNYIGLRFFVFSRPTR